jgi:hypothetical protein
MSWDPSKLLQGITNPITSLITSVGEWQRRQRVWFWVLILFATIIVLPRWDCGSGTKNACLHLEWFYTQVTGDISK